MCSTVYRSENIAAESNKRKRDDSNYLLNEQLRLLENRLTANTIAPV